MSIVNFISGGPQRSRTSHSTGTGLAELSPYDRGPLSIHAQMNRSVLENLEHTLLVSVDQVHLPKGPPNRILVNSTSKSIFDGEDPFNSIELTFFNDRTIPGSFIHGRRTSEAQPSEEIVSQHEDIDSRGHLSQGIEAPVDEQQTQSKARSHRSRSSLC